MSEEIAVFCDFDLFSKLNKINPELALTVRRTLRENEELSESLNTQSADNIVEAGIAELELVNAFAAHRLKRAVASLRKSFSELLRELYEFKGIARRLALECQGRDPTTLQACFCPNTVHHLCSGRKDHDKCTDKDFICECWSVWPMKMIALEFDEDSGD